MLEGRTSSCIAQHEKRNLRVVYESWYITEINNYVFPYAWLIYPHVQLRKVSETAWIISVMYPASHECNDEIFL